MRVLVADGEQRAALAIVRSLGTAGHEVWCAAASRRTPAAASRFCRRSLILPDPLRRPDAFRDAVLDAVETHGIEALLPVTDASLGLALRQRDALERLGVLLPFADADSYDAVSDKRGVLERARTLGIAAPAQTVVASPRDVAAIDFASLPFPVVVKPSRSVVGTGQRRSKTRVDYADDAAALCRALEAAPPEAFPILLQERITGPGVGVFLLLWDGRVAAAFAHRRIREKPPSGGVSVLRESVPLDDELRERSVALLRSFEWRGPAMIEYKRDAVTGVPYLMEVNGRYWGSLQLAIDAGVDFPALHLDLATGVRRPAVTGYRVGVRTRWFLGDVDHLFARLRRSRARLGLPDSAPGRLRAVVEFLGAFGPGTRNEMLRASDPMPAAAELARWLGLRRR